MDTVALIARLKPGCEERAAQLLSSGPPFDPGERGLSRHSVYLSAGEGVFLFEGDQVEWIVRDSGARHGYRDSGARHGHEHAHADQHTAILNLRRAPAIGWGGQDKHGSRAQSLRAAPLCARGAA